MIVLQELRKHNAKDVVRVCDPTYKTERLEAEGVRILVSAVLIWTILPAEVEQKLKVGFLSLNWSCDLKYKFLASWWDGAFLALDHLLVKIVLKFFVLFSMCGNSHPFLLNIKGC